MSGRLAIVGSRNFDDYDLFCKIIDKVIGTHNAVRTIISGGALGVDKFAERYAREHNLLMNIHEADWNKYGKAAGYIRNTDIWNAADFGVAIWDGSSKGTAHSFTLATKQNKILYIFDYKNMKFYKN